MAELLYRGFDAYWADRGNPAFDIACFWNATGRSTRLRVKTTHNHSAIWTVKKNGLIFIDLQPDDDFVVIADLGDGLRERNVYIVPTGKLLESLQADHALYVSLPKRDGTPRKQEQGMRCIRFFGETLKGLGYGYNVKYAKYREAWEMLQ